MAAFVCNSIANFRGLRVSAFKATRCRSWRVGKANHAAPHGRRGLACNAQIGIFYSTTTGNTEAAAEWVKDIMDGDTSDIQEIADVSADALSGYDALIVGAPTWHTDADTDRSGTSWDEKLSTISELDLDGKPVAIFGLGDSAAYGGNFCDAIEEIHDVFSSAGAKMVGYVSTDGYSHTESKSIRDGKFIGLPLDADNEDHLTEERVKAWCTQLKAEGF